MGQTRLVHKVGQGYNGFIGENLRSTKGLKFFFFFSLSHGFFFILGFQRV
jgi:hypothetical protein